jgi:hypothetical protein
LKKSARLRAQAMICSRSLSLATTLERALRCQSSSSVNGGGRSGGTPAMKLGAVLSTSVCWRSRAVISLDVGVRPALLASHLRVMGPTLHGLVALVAQAVDHHAEVPGAAATATAAVGQLIRGGYSAPSGVSAAEWCQKPKRQHDDVDRHQRS